MPPNISILAESPQKIKKKPPFRGIFLFFGFLVQRVFPAPLAIFFQLQFPFNRLLVLVLEIILLLAFPAAELHEVFGKFSLCHGMKI